MNDPEKTLQKLRPVEPPASLDTRMDNLFSAARARTTRGIMRRPVPLWACAVLCAATALFTMSLSPEKGTPQETAVAPDDEVPYEVIIVESTDGFPAHAFDLTQYDELRGIKHLSNASIVVSGADWGETPAGQQSSNSEVTEL